MNTKTAKKKDSHGGVDMTVGNPMEKILKFSVPLLLGNILQQLYNTVDSIVVGQYIGSEALAAVGASGPVINLLVYGKLKSATGTVCTITVLTGLFLMGAGIPASPLLLRLVNTPAGIMGQSVTYMQITFAGVLFLMLFNMFNGIFQGVGDSVSPFLFLAISCAINIVLDLVFVASLGKSGRKTPRRVPGATQWAPGRRQQP